MEQVFRGELRGSIAVGASAPPMIPMDAASARGCGPSSMAPVKAMNMPSCAAAPRNSDLGLAISGPKSVIAPAQGR